MRYPSVSDQACHGAVLPMTETDLLPMVVCLVVVALFSGIFAGASMVLVTRWCWKAKEIVAVSAVGVGVFLRVVAANF